MKKLRRISQPAPSNQERADRLQAAIRENPGEPEGYLELGELLEHDGQYQTALQLYVYGLSQLPGHGPLLLRAGLLLERDGQYEQALPLLETAQAQAASPGAELLEALGHAQLQTAHYAEAIQSFMALLGLGQGTPLELYRLALALQQTGETDKARQYYDQALALDQDTSDPALADEIRFRLGEIGAQPPP